MSSLLEIIFSVNISFTASKDSIEVWQVALSFATKYDPKINVAEHTAHGVKNDAFNV